MTDAEALALFAGKTLSYTYEGGASVTSVFNGASRHTKFGGVPVIEEVIIRNVAPKTFYIIWEDVDRGLATQTVNLDTMEVCTAITMEDQVMVLLGSVTAFA